MLSVRSAVETKVGRWQIIFMDCDLRTLKMELICCRMVV